MRLVHTLQEERPMIGAVHETAHARYVCLTVRQTDEGYEVAWGEMENHDH